MPKFEFAEWEINTILHSLGQRPYNEVASIIRNIKEQTEKAACAANPENPEQETIGKKPS